jgi:hypothetical protein
MDPDYNTYIVSPSFSMNVIPQRAHNISGIIPSVDTMLQVS